MLGSYKNEDFLGSPDARQIRILCELTAPMANLRKNEIENTIVFFGSARSIPFRQATRELNELKEEIGNGRISKEDRIRLQSAERQLRLSRYYEAALSLAKKLTDWSNSIEPKRNRFYICSGGGPGMMEASNRGASEAGGESIGFNISLPFEQNANPYQTKRLSHEFHYFFVRKFWFAYLAKSLVVFPGGFGTMDELFELLTLIQTGKVEKTVPIVLFGREFWESLLNFDTMVDWGTIEKKDLNLFHVSDDVEETFLYLKERLEKLYL